MTDDEQEVLDVIHDEEDCPSSYASAEAIWRALSTMPRDVLLRALGATAVIQMHGIGVTWTLIEEHPPVKATPMVAPA